MGFGADDFDLKTWRGVAAEFIATGLFVFLGCGAVVAVGGAADPAGLVSISLAHGLAIALLVATIAHISGGHINPAVSLAAALSGKMKVSTAALYIAAQMIAAVLGVLLLKGIVAGPVEGMLGAHGLSVYDPATGQAGLLDNTLGDGAGAGLLLEGTLTFALVFVIFATAIDPRGNAALAPIAIGLVVLVDHLVAVPMTGASMNPARTFGPAVVANEWTDIWVYFLGPAIGGAIAALVYEYAFIQTDKEESAMQGQP